MYYNIRISRPNIIWSVDM